MVFNSLTATPGAPQREQSREPSRRADGFAKRPPAAARLRTRDSEDAAGARDLDGLVAGLRSAGWLKTWQSPATQPFRPGVHVKVNLREAMSAASMTR